jgi:hypothetical protein
VELGTVMILLIRLGVLGSVTLLQFRGAGREIQGMSAGNFLKKGNYFDRRLTDGSAFEVIQALSLPNSFPKSALALALIETLRYDRQILWN